MHDGRQLGTVVVKRSRVGVVVGGRVVVGDGYGKQGTRERLGLYEEEARRLLGW